MLSLIPILLVSISSEADLELQFRSTWAANQAVRACELLDELALKGPLSPGSNQLATLARKRCARMALQQNQWSRGEAELRAYRELGGDESDIDELVQIHAAGRALSHFRRGQDRQGLEWLGQIRRPELCSDNFGAQVALAGLRAVERPDFGQALVFLGHLERLAPEQHQAQQLRREIWWEQTGRKWALWFAAASFLLLVVLTTVNLLRTKRRERAVLHSEV
ncbi:MAG: hypothetical protein VX405_10095 [Myxococcota bacterium]|nr:hypothetical protein [Myxococcota bacterium]